MGLFTIGETGFGTRGDGEAVSETVGRLLLCYGTEGGVAMT